MANKIMNFKMDELEIADIKRVTSLYHITITDFIKDAIADYMKKLKADPFYRLAMNVEKADSEESDEILAAIDSLTDDDLEIVSSKHFTV